MIKLSTFKLLNSFKAYQALMNADNVPSQACFALVDANGIIQAKLKAFETVQEGIVRQHGMKNEDGTWKTLPGNQQAILLDEEGQKELAALYDVEVELPIEPIKRDTLLGVSLKPVIYAQLDWLLIK